MDRDASEHETGTLTPSSLVTLSEDSLLHASIFYLYNGINSRPT